ncbi:MAG: hypothetical protein CI953_1044 [Methanohalophilus sp.]|jgi:hypothetical protein|nr:MAG: hypothetical protein CI953_1044 [Methanohalophilus sp.]
MLNDHEIQSLIGETKPVSALAVKDIRPILKKGRQYKEYDLPLTSSNGNRFQVRIRVNDNNPFDFSVILMYQEPQSKYWYILRRYNGKNHTHKNKIEKEKIRGYHIHKATERYQLRGYNIDGYAEEAFTYSNWHDALSVMLGDCNIKIEGKTIYDY